MSGSPQVSDSHQNDGQGTSPSSLGAGDNNNNSEFRKAIDDPNKSYQMQKKNSVKAIMEQIKEKRLKRQMEKSKTE